MVNGELQYRLFQKPLSKLLSHRASRVILTDLPDLLPLLEINRLQNLSSATGVLAVQELTWGNTDQIQALETPDVILMADCIYYGEVSVP